MISMEIGQANRRSNCYKVLPKISF